MKFALPLDREKSSPSACILTLCRPLDGNLMAKKHSEPSQGENEYSSNVSINIGHQNDSHVRKRRRSSTKKK